MLRPFLKCCVCGRPSIILQIANYRPPPLHEVVARRIEKHQKLGKYFEDNKTYVDETSYFKSNLTEKDKFRLKRRTWAKLGSASNIDPASLFPSKEEVEAEMRAEEEWWPTLNQMKENLRIQKEKKEAKSLERSKKIAQNMAKMPMWIKQFQEEQVATRKKEQEMEKQRGIRLQKVQEKFGFEISRRHPQFVEYMDNQKIQEKSKKKQQIKSQKQSEKKV
uniref:Large ribosomal subunit protein mL64 n=1 Tax=Ciona intestinalis TaxID=7719 RepID=F6TUN7_CIOIN|nr:growth arrest and DNA damage-inducible proteins-interacting protein 1-like [Ciona intestinalis]|eukprot:XP_002131257.1 growth arrest and DNA damage-inducible proteins-interacting protein 1-like [Ciona intestinalis]